MERPILVSTDLIKPVQEGRKTETRRLSGLEVVNEEPDHWELIDLVDHKATNMAVFDAKPRGIIQVQAICPYGKPGDVLWVRENWFVQKHHDNVKPSRLPIYAHQGYIADGDKPDWAGKTRPSIHMPKDFCRIRLELLDVSIERLHLISEESAVNEGIERREGSRCQWIYKHYLRDYFSDIGADGSFETLWIKINGQESWDLNPWVWVLKFKRLA